jgi:hypothetical protein
LRANEFCSDHAVEKLMLDITDEQARQWVQAHPEQFRGLPLVPLEECTDATSRPEVLITQPSAGEVVRGEVRIVGTVQLPHFDHYEVQYGVGSDPQGWGWISGPHPAPVRDGLLTRWGTTHLAPGPYTLRVRAFDLQQNAVEARVQVRVVAPTATPTPTPFPTAQSTPTRRPTGTPASPPTTVPLPSETATPLLELTATETAMPVPSSTPEAMPSQ